MSKVCHYCQFCCGALKIATWFYCCCCLHKKKGDEKTEINVLVLGLQNSGKSHLLSTLCSESVDNIQPTNGFSINDVNLTKTIIHMKEVGGSDKIRPFWCHYMANIEGIIFVVDGSESGLERIDEVKTTLHKVMENEQIVNKPLLIVVTKIEPDNSSVHDFVERLQLPQLHCSFIVEFSFSLPELKNALQKYADNVTLQKYADNLPHHHSDNDFDSNPTRI